MAIFYKFWTLRGTLMAPDAPPVLIMPDGPPVLGHLLEIVKCLKTSLAMVCHRVVKEAAFHLLIAAILVCTSHTLLSKAVIKRSASHALVAVLRRLTFEICTRLPAKFVTCLN